jgi:hypothetical protein
MLEIIIHGGDVVIPFPYQCRAHMACDYGGIKVLKPKPSGENMTLPEERNLLTHFAKAAGAGEMLNIHDLKAAYEPRSRLYFHLQTAEHALHTTRGRHRCPPLDV